MQNFSAFFHRQKLLLYFANKLLQRNNKKDNGEE